MLSEDPVDARTLMEKIEKYTMEDGVLYRKSYLVLLMRCVGPFRLITDAKELIRACDDCQAHASVPRLPKADMISGNGAVERANRSLLRGIKTGLEKGGSTWAEEVSNVLWARQTIKKTINGETPFSLSYDTEVVIPAEIGMPTHQTSKLNEKTNDQELHLNLDMPEEQREIAPIREARYKQQTEKYYNKKVLHMEFKVGEFVVRKNKASRAANTGKLGPIWEGPYKVIQEFQSGAYKLSNMEGEEIPRTWHACNL
ncbi:reverse transcriptase domain-containing protein [Tanacetum coccineum]